MDKEKWIKYAFSESLDISKDKLGNINLFETIFKDMMSWYDQSGIKENKDLEYMFKKQKKTKGN